MCLYLLKSINSSFITILFRPHLDKNVAKVKLYNINDTYLFFCWPPLGNYVVTSIGAYQQWK